MNCAICSGKHTVQEVYDMADMDIDDGLCRKHLQQQYNRRRKRIERKEKS
jgi:hypothetical protein